jgi:hypothetical protein
MSTEFFFGKRPLEKCINNHTGCLKIASTKKNW